MLDFSFFTAVSADFFPNKAVLVTYFQFLTQLLYKLNMGDYNIISVTMHRTHTHILIVSCVCAFSPLYDSNQANNDFTHMHSISFEEYYKKF